MAPKRKRLVRFPSDEIQGKGSWVLIACLTVKEMRELRRLAKQAKAEMMAAEVAGAVLADDAIDMFEVGVGVLKTHAKEWNWVDDEGEPMPQPKDNPEIIEELLDPESAFLSKCIQGSEDDAKN